MDPLARTLADRMEESGRHLRELIEPPALARHLLEGEATQSVDYAGLLKTEAQANYASEFHERLVKMISEFEADLDLDHEVGIQVVKFGEAETFHLTSIGYYDPSLIHFYARTDEGHPVELIQHVIQISVLLRRLPKLDEKPIRMGFHREEAEE